MVSCPCPKDGTTAGTTTAKSTSSTTIRRKRRGSTRETGRSGALGSPQIGRESVLRVWVCGVLEKHRWLCCHWRKICAIRTMTAEYIIIGSRRASGNSVATPSGLLFRGLRMTKICDRTRNALIGRYDKGQRNAGRLSFLNAPNINLRTIKSGTNYTAMLLLCEFLPPPLSSLRAVHWPLSLHLSLHSCCTRQGIQTRKRLPKNK